MEWKARLSARRRARRPLPATRSEADELFRPSRPDALVLPPRLARLNALGCLRLVPPGSGGITQAQAHEAILDAMYDEDGVLRVDGPPSVAQLA